MLSRFPKSPSAFLSAEVRPVQNSCVASSRAPLLVIAAFALVLGTCVYITDRPAGQAMWIPSVRPFAGLELFGPFGAWLPSFVHPFAFGLFTAALIRRPGGGCYAACAAWGVVDVAFEFGQRVAFKSQLLDALHGPAGRNMLLRPILVYLHHGTFDQGDVIAVVAGATAAGALLFMANRIADGTNDATSR